MGTETTGVENAEIAERLEAFAALLDLAAASSFSVRAYRRAAELVRATPAPVAELVRTGRVRELAGIGPGIERRLQELVETGEIAELRELEAELSPELVGFGRLIGLGPARMAEIGRGLGVRTVDELRVAAEAGRLGSLRGVGPKTEERILAALRDPGPRRPRRGLTLNRAWALAGGIAEAIGGEVAGDTRRWRDSSERLAVVVPATEPGAVLDRLEALPQLVAVVEREAERAVGVTVDGVPVEVVAAPPARFGTALFRATGPAELVERLEPLPDAATEAALLEALGLPPLPPELRDTLVVPPGPLLELADMRGDLHVHSTWSDGKSTVLEMAQAARDRGYEYLAICDHTRSVRVVPGLDGDDVRRQAEEIAAANEALAPFRVLRGIECDILPDGSLDLPDDVLVELDWVQVSLHAGQRAQRRELTKRVVEAMRHPAARCLSHPTGRLINHRPPNALDLEEAFRVALETGVALEVNGLPDRLDLRDDHVRLAIEAGVPIVCSTDAHSVRGLGYMQLSVATARRGGATAANVLNTRPLADFVTQGG
jgi:DNA polymerase (family 10)